MTPATQRSPGLPSAPWPRQRSLGADAARDAAVALAAAPLRHWPSSRAAHAAAPRRRAPLGLAGSGTAAP